MPKLKGAPAAIDTYGEMLGELVNANQKSCLFLSKRSRGEIREGQC